MKCHQILTGAVNSGDHTYSTGSVEGVHFCAYCSGCNIVILSPNFQPVQIIPGTLNNNVQVNCINASNDVGRIAACYGGPFRSNHQLQPLITATATSSTNRICIFEPRAILDQISDHRLDFEWIKTSEIEPNFAVSVLSFNVEGTKLLLGGVQIQLWQSSPNDPPANQKHQPSEDEGIGMKPIKSTTTNDHQQSSSNHEWMCVWSCQTSTPVCHLSFSPDGTLFCSIGRADRLVKIWYETSTKNYPSNLFENGSNGGETHGLIVGHGKSYRSNLTYSFIYLPHPRAVIGISWRKVSKYMPKSSVANMIVTSCRDNICRVWVQTFLPEDDLVNVSQLDGVSDMVTPRAQTQRHRQKILHFFRHRKHHLKHHHHRHRTEGDHEGAADGTDLNSNLNLASNSNGHDAHPIPTLPSTFSCHDFHGYGVHGTAITPGELHFHLTASINAENDIPLVPCLTHHPSESDINSGNIGPKVTISNNDQQQPTTTGDNDNVGGGGGSFNPSQQGQSHHHHHEESDKPLFVVNWLNNKEMAFTQSAERILHEIVANLIAGEKQQQQQQAAAAQKLKQEQDEEMSITSNANSDNTVESVVMANKKIRTYDQPGSAQPIQQPGITSSRNSSSNASIVTAVGQDPMGQDSPDHHYHRRTVVDYLDRKIESLMREWNRSSDLLYSIHPLDGSLLVWLVEYLDEPCPSMFRQPQISFSSRIPNSIALGDASTMSHNVSLYSPDCCLDLKTAVCTSSSSMINAALATTEQQQQQRRTVNLTHKTQQQQNQQQPLFGPHSYATPTLCMVTKHNNGSLNLWRLSFSEKGHFTQLLSIGHQRRICGHRFRVNDIACHPILPLLVTTSHHNMPGTFRSRAHSVSPYDPPTPNTPDSAKFLVSPSNPNQPMIVESKTFPNTGFCSELILWKVEPVGPLMKSGGITELARINSLEPTAFANVAWIPILLPSTALGSISNSPSACFVASDGRQLRIYQALIDARSLLAEAQRYMLNTSDQRRFYYDSSEDEDDEPVSTRERKNTEKVDHEAFRSLFKIVSLQSTARPGCVLELSPIVDARHDWQNTQLLHLFQEQLIKGNVKKSNEKIHSNPGDDPGSSNQSDHQQQIADQPYPELTLSSSFDETFYLVVIEKTGICSTLHMWQVGISSRAKIDSISSTTAAVIQDLMLNDDDSSRSNSPEDLAGAGGGDHYSLIQTPPLRIKTRKVCSQKLALPVDVEVIHATPSAGHLSSSNIYPACYAPFLIATACSDNRVRFWHCNVLKEEKDGGPVDTKFQWLEWEMALNNLKNSPEHRTSGTETESNNSSVIELPGSPLYISCAYSGRIACAFKLGHSFVDDTKKKKKTKTTTESTMGGDGRFINVGISIYECQSSGGSEWVLEDTVQIDSIPLIKPSQLNIESHVAPLVDQALRNRKLSPKPNSNPFAFDESTTKSSSDSATTSKKLIHTVASHSTIQSLRQTIAEQGNQFTFLQKSPILLDWVSTEDGSHLLTCSAGHKLALFAPISHAKLPTTGTAVEATNQSSSTTTKSLHSQSSTQMMTTIPGHQTKTATKVSSAPNTFRMNTFDLSSNTIPVTKWMMFRIEELSSIDSLPPLPMQLSWVRDGILVVGMDNEMQIFTQWKISLPTSLPMIFEKNFQSKSSPSSSSSVLMAIQFPFDSVEFPPDRLFTGFKSGSGSSGSQQSSAGGVGVAGIGASSNLSNGPESKSSAINDKIISNEYEDFGLFESFRNSSPNIPQYHPKQLMELLAFGKIHRVRAILSHLVTSLCSINSVKEYLHHPANMQQQHASFESGSDRSPRQWTRTRALSVAAQHSPRDPNSLGGGGGGEPGETAPIVAEEIQLDYTEIASLRPLPLYALIQADDGVSKESKSKTGSGVGGGGADSATGDGSGKKDVSWDLPGLNPLDSDTFLDYSYKSQVEETLDEFLGERTAFNFSNVATSKFLKQQQQSQNNQEMDMGINISINFDKKQASLLSKLLTHSHLPGLTSLDQMHLLALADSLASFSQIDQNQGSSTTDQKYGSTTVGHFEADYAAGMDEQQITVTANSLDDCGLRYLLNMRQHLYLLKCLPLKQRTSLQRNGLGTHNIIWAFHSETQEELVQLILSSNTKITWQDLKELGCGFWIRNNALLKKVIERLAKIAFKAKNDPLDASLYYLAMKKKNLVWGLYRSCQDKKMTDFFSHNFAEDKWRKAALKNAYALMGKQRFEHSVSFFLLAGSLWDAVEICINKLDDLQLAMVIIRLYEGGDIDAVPETMKRLLHEEILGYRNNNVQDMNYAHPDPFLRSMAYWMLGECNQALSTLLEVNVGSKHYRVMNETGLGTASTTTTTTTTSVTGQGSTSFEGLHSNVFNFYLYLRTHPLIVRRSRVARQNIDNSSGTQDNVSVGQRKSAHMFTSSANKADAVAVTPFERRLFFLTAYRHLQAGCPSLALEVLSRLPTNIMSDSEKNEMEECSRRLSIHNATATLDHLDEASSSTTKATASKAEDLFSNDFSSGMDWGAPASNLFAPVAIDDLELKIDLGTDDPEDEDVKQQQPNGGDNGGSDRKMIGKKKKVSIEEISDDNDVFKAANDNDDGCPLMSKIDVMTQQFKFISCLKIIMEELSTLATGFEVDGGQLRYQLYIWLERTVQVLKDICKYHTFSIRSASDRASMDIGQHKHSLIPVAITSNKQSGILVNVCGNRKSSDNSGAVAAPLLHEILLADTEDFQSKLDRYYRRKVWLLANEALLRNLLSYCSLHGAHGGGLASVQMELILLLQELQQDRSPQQQLLSPLPLPTTIPLLTAAAASQKTVVADPIRHLQSMAHDILQTLTEINTFVHIPTSSNYSSLPDFLALPPFMVSGTATSFISVQDSQISQPNYISTLYTLIHILRDLGISLSSCIYQSLCDCDSLIQNNMANNNNSSHGGGYATRKSFLSRYKDKGVVAGKDPLISKSSANPSTGSGQEDTKLVPTTSPIKWPGVQSLNAMIVREKDDDLPKLHTLLCEGFVAVYLSQLVYALTICDSSILYRLAGMKFTETSWGDLFGGGAQKKLLVSTSTMNMAAAAAAACSGNLSPNAADQAVNGTDQACSPHYDLLNTLSKQRMKLHMKILEQLNQAAEVVGNVATSPSSTLQSITNPFMAQQQPSPQSQQLQTAGQASTAGGGLAPVQEQRATIREVFVPPKVSIINYLMIKPQLPDELCHLDYDSFGSGEEELEENDDDDETSLSNKFKTYDDDVNITEEEYNDWAMGNTTTTGAGASGKSGKINEKKKANLEYELYAWCIIRLAITKITYEKINNFLQVSGLEKSDLPTTSPAIHAMLRTLVRWQCALQFYMNEFTSLPDHFLPNMFVDTNRSGPALQKYKALFETNNTPFRAGYTSVKSAKRLWNYLVRQPSVQDIFIRYIFGKDRALKLAREHGATAICYANSGVAINEQFDSHQENKQQQPSSSSSTAAAAAAAASSATTTTNEDGETGGKAESVASFGAAGYRRLLEPMRIVHKDQDNISAFCVNRSNTGLIALSTPKEIQELNIKPLLEVCVPWMEEDTELDILNLKQRSFEVSLASSYVDFLLVQHPTDRLQTSPGGLAFQKQTSSQQTPNKQAILVKRHKTETVRRLASHPTFPLYLSGGQDGCVQLWEWAHQHPISTPRPPGTYAKVTHVGFSQQGSKFGVTDSDGTLSLWQVSNTSANASFWNTQCHNKTTSDFTFLNSSTLLMAAGHSTDHRNVVLLDTLVPNDRSIVSSFACHEHSGASSIVYAPLNQLVITGGKKGDIFIFDIRQRIQKDHFHAHETAIKCIALEPSEEFFATGSADGDIKVWSLMVGQVGKMLYQFLGEHARSTFFRNIGMGVSHLYIDTCGRLFSCGADGSLKMRHLPTLECQPTNFFMPTSASNLSLVFGSGSGGGGDQLPGAENSDSHRMFVENLTNGTTII